MKKSESKLLKEKEKKRTDDSYHSLSRKFISFISISIIINKTIDQCTLGMSETSKSSQLSEGPESRLKSHNRKSNDPESRLN